MNKFVRKIAGSLLLIISSVSLGFGLSACSPKSNTPVELPDAVSTVRKEAPQDGSTPLDHSAIDNIAYMAYVLDNQPYYHSYAKNSTKSTGYEQVTQTWKDYKSAGQSGIGNSVMICSDLSYSALIKFSNQTCYIGNEAAYMRTGNKPSKNTVANEITWNEDQPEYYDKQTYLGKYGEFSTELSVYVITEDTVESAGNVVNNGDGTYSLRLKLNEDAACYYKYGMKTRGSLRTYPAYESIDITFTFDSSWRVLRSYCEEKAQIAPGALGGMQMSSDSKSEVTFEYGYTSFDGVHYSNYDKYFSQYVGKDLTGSGSGEEEIDVLTLLGNGFKGVVDPAGNGQQFAMYLTVGDTEYNGKLYAKLGDMGDILGSLDVRMELSKEGSDQDLYVEFADGEVNAYYSDGFALTADIGKVSASVSKLTQWIKGFNGTLDAETVAYALEGDTSGGLDLNSLLASLELITDKSSACIRLKTDNLLGLGLGLNLQMYFDKVTDENGSSYSFNSLYLNSVAYGSQAISVSGTIVPDNSPIISRDPSQSKADVADVIDGVLGLLQSEIYNIDVKLDGTCEGIEYIKGLELDATAQVKAENGFKNISVNLPMEVSYKGLTVKLEAYYTIDLNSGNYGEIYLRITEIGGADVDAKIYCDIKDAVNSITKIIDYFTADSGLSGNADNSSVSSKSRTLAETINAVLGLNFGAIITDLKANENLIGVTVDADEILQAVGLNTGISFGKVSLSIGLKDGKAMLSGSLPALGLTVGVNGSDGQITPPVTERYADVTAYLDGLYELLNSTTYSVNVALDGTCKALDVLNGLELSANAYLQLGEGINKISVYLPMEVSYRGISLSLTAYYTIDLNDKDKGEVYLNLYSLGFEDKKIDADAKIYCNVDEVITAVNLLIGKFTPSENEGDYSAQTRAVSDVIGGILSADFSSLIGELKADDTAVGITVNADEILKLVNLNLGGISLGTATLDLGLDGNGLLTLSGKIPDLGMTLSVGGSDIKITAPDKNGYADITAYVNAVSALLDSTSYSVNVSLDGTCEAISILSGLEVNASAQIMPENGFNKISVNLPVTIRYNGLEAELNAFYTIDLSNGDWGEVYLSLNKLNYSSTDPETNQTKEQILNVDVNVYCNIKSVKQAVETLIGRFVSTNSYDTYTATEFAVSADKISGVIESLLSIDFASLIGRIKADAEKLSVTVNADEILGAFGIDTGELEIGDIALDISLSGGNLSLEGSAKKLGLIIGVSGSGDTISAPSANGFADVTAYAEGVNKLLDAKTYLVTVNLDGENGGVQLLKDARVRAEAEVSLSADLKSIAVFLPLSVAYKDMTASLEAYYTINLDNGDYGRVYLKLTEINGIEFSARVTADISELKSVIERLIEAFSDNGEGKGSPSEQAEISSIIEKVFAIDFSKLINELTANGEGIVLSISADEILSALGVDLSAVTKLIGDFKLGAVVLNLGLDKEGVITLGGALPELGLKIGLTALGRDEINTYDKDKEYFDITELACLIEQAYARADEIIQAEDAEFTLDAVLTVDGVKMNVKGSGEVVWKDGKIRVAVQTVLAIDDTATENGKDEIAINLVYDETAEESSPLARVTVNGLGLNVYSSDIGGIKDGVDGIISAVSYIMGKLSAPTENFEEQAVPVALSEEADEAEAPADGFRKALDSVLELLKNVTVNMREGKTLVLAYAQNGELELGADGGLSLRLNIRNNNQTEIAGVSASVKAGDGSAVSALNTLLDEGGYKFYNDGNSFIKNVYEFVFGVLDDMTVGNILGSGTYSVRIELRGALSEISALKDIDVNADLYYTENTQIGSKLVSIKLDMNIKGVTVIASVYFNMNEIYVSLSEINGMKLTDIAFKAGVGEIYSVAETLVSIITSEKLIEIIDLLFPETSVQPAALSLGEDNGESKKSLTDILSSLMSLNLDEAVKFGKTEEGNNTLTLNPDGILAMLGLNVKVGTVYAEVNPKTHAIHVNATAGENRWLNLNAEVLDEVNAPVFDATGYIDIGFATTLLDDIYATLDYMDEGEVLLSLTGDINIGLASLVTIKITDVTLSVGFNSENSFYFTLYGYLNSSIASTARYISISFSDGLITFGRDVDNAGKAIYKVMTLEYLIDNMLSSNNSPLRWLLGTSSGTWKTVISILNAFVKDLSLSSGLTDTEEFYLYNHVEEQPSEPVEQPEKQFSISDFINGWAILLGGNSYGFGNNASSALGQLGLSNGDNYYAFDVNLSKLASFINPLYAALIRSENGGLSGIKAYTEISGQIKLTVNLDGGLTKNHAPDYYGMLKSNINLNYYGNYEDRTFGCYNSETAGYEYSLINRKYTLNVYDVDGSALVEGKQLRARSVVYLAEEEIWLGENQKVVFVDRDGNDLGLSFVITSDIDVYKTIVGEKTVNFYFADGRNYSADGSQNSITEYSGTLLADGTLAVDNMSFAGWYTDSSLTNYTSIIPYTGNVINLYAKYVETAVIVNGIKYSFVRDGSASGGHYTVSGFSDIPEKYTRADNYETLVLEREVRGYPVTEIGLQGLKASKLKDVIVPETITKIGAEGFMDNYGIQRVVFLAPVVHLGGTTSDGTNNRYVFFGCSENDNGTTSSLKIYYNEFTVDDDTNWNTFRTSKEGGFMGIGATTVYHKFELGTHLFPAGTWAYVEYEIDGVDYSLSDLGLENSMFYTEAFDYEAIEGALRQRLYQLTYNENDNSITVYTVTISRNYSLNGLLVLTVSFTNAEKWYNLNVTSNNTSFGAYCTVNQADVVNTELGAFVRAGASVTLERDAETENIKFDKWTSSQVSVSGNSFVMPQTAVTVTANWHEAYAENIYVYSEVAYVYDGAEYEYGRQLLENATLDSYLLPLTANGEKASEYTFLGWATANGDSLALQSRITVVNHTEPVTYYAIWSANHIGDLDYDTASEGSMPNDPTEKEGCGGEFYGWYSDAQFNNEVTSLTVNSTVLYARLSYSLEVQLYGQNRVIYLDSTVKDTQRFQISKKNTATLTTFETFAIYENDTIEMSYSSDWKTFNIAVTSTKGNYTITARINTASYNTIGGGFKSEGSQTTFSNTNGYVLKENSSADSIINETGITTPANILVSNNYAVVIKP